MSDQTMKNIFFVLLLFGISVSAALGQQKNYRDVNVAEFKALTDSLQNAVVLDLRTPDELKQGIIPNATNIDYFTKDFEDRIAKLDPSKTYLLYCGSGARSSETMDLMKANGFKCVYNLDGGFIQWKKQKMPIVPFQKP
jgi:rhodanese-related sulfurtransferase